MKGDDLLLIGAAALAAFFLFSKKGEAEKSGGSTTPPLLVVPAKENLFAEPGTTNEELKTTLITSAPAKAGGVGWQKTLKNYDSQLNQANRNKLAAADRAQVVNGVSTNLFLKTTATTSAPAKAGGVGWQTTLKNYNARVAALG